MLDIKFIRENEDVVRAAAAKKHVDVDIPHLLQVDEQRRVLLKEVEDLRAEQNKASDAVAKTSASEREPMIASLKDLKNRLGVREKELKNIEEEFSGIILKVPNVPDLSVPDGNSDADNVEVRRWTPTPEGRSPDQGVGSDPPKFNFMPKSSIELMESLDLADLERGAKVSGFRGYFLKNEGVLLSMALWQLAFEQLVKKGFTLHLAPALARGVNFVGTGWLPQGKDEIYHVGDDLYLAGTAEVPMMGMHQGETFDEADLPKTYAAFSPCFRSEAGSYGKDVKGLYRVHEFMKVEQVVLCRADHEESVRWHEELAKNAEEFMQALELPYRVVVNCGADLGLGQVKKYDIETWIPSQQKYGETHSSSYFHDFQTRRLNIRYRDASGKIHFAHSLNNTMVATPRILIQLLENYQQEDGSVLVPKVLQKWVGKERIMKRGA